MVAGTHYSIEAAVLQHRQLKDQYPDMVIFLRMGNFFRTFGVDALECAVILPTKLDEVEVGGEKIPMLDFTHHSTNDYLQLLLDVRRQVVIVEVREMKVYSVVTVFGGVFESLHVFFDKALADEYYEKLLMEDPPPDNCIIYLLEGIPGVQAIMLRESPPVPDGVVKDSE